MLRSSCFDVPTHALSSSQGIWQSGCKASSWFRIPTFMLEHVMGSPETGSNLWKPCKKAVDLATKPQREMQVSCAGNNQSAGWPNFDGQVTELETLQSVNLSKGNSYDPIQQTGDTCTPPSSESCSRGLHVPVQLPSEPKCNEGSPHASVHGEHDIDEGFHDHVSGLTGPFLENQGVNAGISNSGKYARQSCGDIQHLDKEHEDCHDGIKTTNSFVDVETPGNTNATTESFLSPEDRQGVSFENGNEDGDQSNLTITGADVEASIDASSSSSFTATLRLPAYRTPTQLQPTLNDSVAYFESLGVDWRSVFQAEPGVSCCMVEQIRAMVSALELYGLKWTDTGRLFNICPKILLLEPERDLKAVTSFLFNEAGISPTDFRRLVRRCPRLLVADVKTQLRPTLSFLRSLGYPKMSHTVTRNPCLLSFDVKTRLIPRLRLLESWGFTYREAAAIAARFPAIFNYSETGNLQRKYEYLKEEMGGGKEELLVFPQFFGYSLEWRIRPRHQCIVKLNVSLPIPAMLTMPDAEFSARFLCVDEQDNECKRDSLYQTIKKKLHEHSMNSVEYTNLESAETPVLISA